MKTNHGRKTSGFTRAFTRGFTLVELLVVIGIIAMLMSMLLPALSRAKGQAISVKCKAQMRDLGIHLAQYALENRGVWYPVGELKTNSSGELTWLTLGYEPTMRDLGRGQRWPVPVYKIEDEYTKNTWVGDIKTLTVKNPEVLKCPADINPAEDHTYILNKHLAVNFEKRIKQGSRVRNKFGSAKSDSDVVLAGEKKLNEPDYYMEAKASSSEFTAVVELYKHGLKLGSNYLYLDGHVDIVAPQAILDARDSWDPIGDLDPVPPTKP